MKNSAKFCKNKDIKSGVLLGVSQQYRLYFSTSGGLESCVEA